jgi:hypothetical protein
MSWGRSAALRKAEVLARESQSSTDQLLALLIEEISELRKDLADERRAAEARRDQDSRRGR